MAVYLALLGIIFFGDLITKKNKTFSNIYHIVIFVVMVLISGLRNPEMGLNDFSNGYLQGWQVVCSNDWEGVFSYVGNTNSALKDVGFAIVCKLLSYVSTSELFFQIVINIPYFAVLCWFVSKYSEVNWLSYIVLIVLQYFTFSYYVLRPMYAIIFVILATDSIVCNKNKRAFIYSVIAVTMHSSAIAFFVVFLLNKIKSMKLFPVFIGSAFFIGLFGKEALTFILTLLLGESRFTYYLTANLTEGLSRFFIALIFFLLSCYRYYTITKIDEKNRLFINMSMISCVFLALTPIIADFWRIALYFEFVNSILLPKVLINEKLVSNRVIFLLLSIPVFLVYLFLFLLPGTNALPYVTYFE